MAAASMTTVQAAPRTGSTTVEEHGGPSALTINVASGTLRLRARNSEERHIQWADDVIDNEGMGKKSSKVCCIYHKPRAVGESSDEESSDSSSSDSDSDSEPDNSRARPIGGGRGRRHHHHHHDDHGDGDSGPNDNGKGQQRKRSPNAYEKMPKYKKNGRSS